MQNENKTPPPDQSDPGRNAPLSLRAPTRRRLPQRTARLAKIGRRTRSLENPVALRYPFKRLEALEKRASGPMPRRSGRQLLSKDRFLVRRGTHPGRRSKESARKGSPAYPEEGPDNYRDRSQSTTDRQPVPSVEAAPRPLRRG